MPALRTSDRSGFSKKKKQAIRHSQAVSLPHDGPLHYRFLKISTTRRDDDDDDSNDEDILVDGQGTDSDVDENESIETTALHFLSLTSSSTEQASSATTPSSTNKNAGDDRTYQAISTLLGKLRSSQQIQHQLAALQAFKTTLLQLQKQGESKDNKDEDAARAALQRTKRWLLAVYRILLEWSASFQTPLPLRKTIHALLDAMWKKVLMTMIVGKRDEDDSSLTDSDIPVSLDNLTFVPVLDSVVVGCSTARESTSSINKEHWKRPIHSLEVLLTLATIHDDENNSNTKSLKGPQAEPDKSDHAKVAAKQINIPSFFDHVLDRVWPYLEWFATNRLIPQLQDNNQSNTTTSVQQSMDRETEDLLEEAIRTSLLIKSLLEAYAADDASAVSTRPLPSPLCRKVLLELTWLLLVNPHTPTESLVVISMAHGQLILALSSSSNDTQEQLNEIDWKQQLRKKGDKNDEASDKNSAVTNVILPSLPRAVLLQGLLAAAATDDDLFVVASPSTNSNQEPLVWDFLQDLTTLVSTAVDPEVRLAALKGLRTLIHRCSTWIRLQRQHEKDIDITNSGLSQGVDVLMECILAAWENPPTRKIASTIPLLFESTLDLSFLLASKDNEQIVPQSLVQKFLEQPPNRKGRYKALELLLPRVGARRLLQAGVILDSDGAAIDGTDKSGPSPSSARSNLLEDLLAGIAEVGNNTGAIADLWAKLLHSLLMEEDEAEAENKEDQSDPSLPATWINAWVPSLARWLTDVSDSKRRKQVASFCLQRIKVICGEDRPELLALSFTALIDHVHYDLKSHHATLTLSPSPEHESFVDRAQWTLFELVRMAGLERLLDGKAGRFPRLDQSIAAALPIERLREGLVHFSPLVRMVAFQSMNYVVNTYPGSGGDEELKLWRECLPYGIKTDTREYRSSVLYSLLSFMDRTSMEGESKLTDPLANPGQENFNVHAVPLLRFAVDFLLNDLFARKTAYPGSVFVKETFALSLLECVIVFTCRELDIALDSKLLPKTGSMFHRKRSKREETVIAAIRQAILGNEVVASLFSLLQSSWDSSRNSAFHLLSILVSMSRTYGMSMPPRFFRSTSESEGRAFFLVSSPRQREADTGARLISLICISKPSFNDRVEYLRKLLSTLETRTADMKASFDIILSDSEGSSGGDLPLAHGIIQAIQLSIVSKTLRGHGDQLPQNLLSTISLAMSRALQVSLAVVADLKDGEQLEGIGDDSTAHRRSSDGQKTTGKINPGAIGANGIFASLSRLDKAEYKRRLASQRIIVGSWLLMKEACAGAATVLTTKENTPDEAIVNRTALLLINTLTTLKHTGAAYAAHSSFQQIAQASLENKNLKHLPPAWNDRMINEITLVDKVKDSTLRRSTGYALGFLSIMRSDVAVRKPPRVFSKNTIQSILHLASPSIDWLEKFSRTVFQDRKTIFFGSLHDDRVRTNTELEYSIRTRIHALNVLRMIVLDAPLGKDIQPFIGDAVAIAIMGYVDSEWGVRNSSTMVFAACLLRVVDADKNNSNSDAKSSNAITLAELFRSYPELPSFLRAVLDASLADKFAGWETNDLPPILPILILLYRVQPSNASDFDSVEHFATFVPTVMKCLGHRHIAVRQAAARALGNMASSHKHSATYHGSILKDSFVMLRHRTEWNRGHGCFLVINELLRTYPEVSKETWQKEYTETLQDLVSQNAPPLYLAEGLRSLEALCKLHPNLTADLEQRCFSILLQGCRDQPDPRLSVGLAEQTSVAASVAMNIVMSRITDNARPADSDAEKVLSLLVCSQIDARMAAIKSFKKRICASLDGILALSERDAPSATHALMKFKTVIVSALQKELTGGFTAHPPSLRRLSRCLLECAEVHLQLGGSDLSLLASSGEALFQWVEGIRKHRGEDDVDYDENTASIHGNAAELLTLSRVQHSDTSRLSRLVESLCDQNLSWRLRYSSATSFRNLVQGGQYTLGDKSWDTCSCLLQDDDNDVRYTASRTVASSRSIPAAERALVSLATGGDYVPNVVSLVNRLHTLIEETERSVSVFTKELIAGLDERAHNVETDRKIFEEEAANSYAESSLDMQARVVAMVRADAKCDKEIAEDTHSRCNKLLSTLSRLSPEVKAETTRANRVFAGLHSILLGCLCLKYMASTNGPGLGEDMMALFDGDCHPLVKNVCEALFLSLQPTAELRHQILKNCFLFTEESILDAERTAL